MSGLPFKPDDGGGLLFIRVTPKSARGQIAGLHTGADGKLSLQVKVRAQPEKGKANEAAIELLAEALGLPKRSFAIAAGATDRLKTVRIAGDPVTIRQKLNDIIQDQSS
ncbi:DUF167 family protein [Taklimakanibacter deserti]|uniref:DUF167 family protein n=1 Tax=Taklimakanibacter deserti TaxID=2267839 RepID=UPI0013C437B2